jgi:hypothetical protein
MWKYILSGAAMVLFVSGTGSSLQAAEPGTTAKEASIPFANHGGVDDWRAVDDHTLLIKGLGRQWYKAELFSPCIDMKYTDTIGFLVEPDGSLSRWSGVVVRHQVCRFKSLVKTDPPTPSKKTAPKKK